MRLIRSMSTAALACPLLLSVGCIEPITADLFATLDLDAQGGGTSFLASTSLDPTANPDVEAAAAWVRVFEVSEVEVTVVNVGDENAATTVQGDLTVSLDDGNTLDLGSIDPLPVVFAESTMLSPDQVASLNTLLQDLQPLTMTMEGEVDEQPLDFDLLFRFSVWASG